MRITPHKQEITIKKNSIDRNVMRKPPASTTATVGGSVGEELGVIEGSADKAILGLDVGDALGAPDGWYVCIVMVGEKLGLGLGLTVPMLGSTVGDQLGCEDG